MSQPKRCWRCMPRVELPGPFGQGGKVFMALALPEKNIVHENGWPIFRGENVRFRERKTYSNHSAPYRNPSMPC